jgi:hypothetical protein
MKKEAKVEYGITITKPWSREMYDHNDEVAENVKSTLDVMWRAAVDRCEDSREFDEEDDREFLDLDWSDASAEMVEIQIAVTCYKFGCGYSIYDVMEQIEMELDRSASFRLKEIAEELDIVLEKGFIGFN